MKKVVEQNQGAIVPDGHGEIFEKLAELYRELFEHNGYGALRVEMRFLKKGQKEIFVISGKEYRFVVDYPGIEGAVATCGSVSVGGDAGRHGTHRASGKTAKEKSVQQTV